MNKTILIKICNLISVILIACFFVNTLIDYTRYSIADSAPFSLTVILNAIVFLSSCSYCIYCGDCAEEKSNS